LRRPIARVETTHLKTAAPVAKTAVVVARFAAAVALGMSALTVFVTPARADDVAGFATLVRGDAPRSLGSVGLGQLPPQAQETDRLIHQGGPFPYPKDGVVFGNRERALPRESRGFYHEYTVPTPGAHNRGARRIVCGGNPPSRPAACFYTDDHYQTFRRITP
jgi:ribonuclease T1